MKIKKGQTVWFIVNRGRKTSLQEGIVSSSGKKYITVDEQYKFHTDTLQEVTDYGSPGNLYTDKQEYLDQRELNNVNLILRTYFRNDPTLSLAQAKEIMAIIGLDENKDHQ